MKNHRFLWLRNRTTNNRKCEKARNIKEKRTIEMFNTVSKPPVAHLSSASADRLFYFPRLLWPPGESFRPGAFACFAPAEQPRPRGIAAAVKALISFKRYCKAPESRGIPELFPAYRFRFRIYFGTVWGRLRRSFWSLYSSSAARRVLATTSGRRGKQ